MKKLSDFKDNERKGIENEIKIGQAGLPTDWDDEIVGKVDIEKYGLCNNCQKVRISRTKYGRTHAYCELWEKFLNEIDPIVECTKHQKRGQISMWDMQRMAIIIDIDKKKVGLL